MTDEKKKEMLLREALKLQDIINAWGYINVNGKPAAMRLMDVCNTLKEDYGVTEDSIDEEISKLKK